MAALMIAPLPALAVWTMWISSTAKEIRAGRDRRIMAAWPLAPVLALVTAASIAAGLPLEVRFRSSHEAFDTLATRLMEAPTTTVPSPVGSFEIRYAEVYDGTVFLATSGCVISQCGFVFGDPTVRCEWHRPIVDGWSTCSYF
jgi:hypothetical protein